MLKEELRGTEDGRRKKEVGTSNVRASQGFKTWMIVLEVTIRHCQAAME